jgi:diguanylate cyclase (GGDEF)-like protein/PAS domain S-box-containing protein
MADTDYRRMERSPFFGLSSRVSVRLASWTMALGFALSLLITSLQAYQAYRGKQVELDNYLQSVGEFTLPALSESAWVFDKSHLQLTLDSFSMLPNVSAAQLQVTGQRELQVGMERLSDKALSRRFKLAYSDEGHQRLLGTLVLHTDMAPVQSQLINSALLTLAGNVLVLMIMSLLMGLTNHLVATRRLLAVADDMRKFTADDLRALPLQPPVPGAAAQDEIDELMQAIDTLKTTGRQALAASDDRQLFIRTLFNTLPDLVWIKDPTGVYLACNRLVESFLGAKEADILGKSDFAFTDEASAEKFLRQDRLAMSTGHATTHEEWLGKADGSYRGFYEVTKTPVFGSGGQLVGVLGIAHDMTERKKFEDALHEREQRYRSLFDGSVAAIVVLDNQQHIAQINKSAAALLGVTADALLGMPVQTILADDEAAKPTLSYLRGGGRLLNFEHQLRTGNGSLVTVLNNTQPLTNALGEVQGTLTTLIDITTRHQSEKGLRDSELRYRSLIEHSPLAIQEFTPDGLTLRVNQAWENLWQTPFDALRHYNVLEDPQLAKNGILAKLKRAFAGESVEISARAYDKAKNLEVASQPGVVWVRALAYPVLDDLGRLIEVVLVQEDVSDRVVAEDLTRQAALVYQTSTEGMMVTDAKGVILSVNPSFELATGYSAAEVIGREPKMLSSGRQGPDFYGSMWQEINTTGRWQGELWNRRKDGSVYLERLSINTNFNADGTVHRRVALFSDITQQRQTEEMVWKQANFDSLTGLPNRRLLRDRLEQEIKKSSRTNEGFAVLHLDLDHFKEVNDALGHHYGDVLLSDAAQRMASCIRETDTLARLSSDEFIILLAKLADATDIERIAKKLLSRLSSPFALGVETVYVSASIGVAVYPTDATDAETLLKNADQAMLVAKREGRNRYCYHTPGMHVSAQARLRLVNELRQATSAQQLRIVLQPIVELATGQTHKCEALVRWQHPTQGLLGPSRFISLAEDSGLIQEVGDWVFREAANWVQSWRKRHDPRFQISVNKSPLQFHLAAGHDAWSEHLRAIELPGQALVVEITEGLLLRTDASSLGHLESLRRDGIEVAIDDFGTGYSALSYLNRFDIDYLKIDQSFTRHLSPGSSELALTEAIIVMAHKLGLKVIAEGVETEEQRRLLLAAGCDLGQGYLFSRPIAPPEFEQWLVSNETPASAGPTSMP